MRILFGSIILGDFFNSFWVGLAVFMIACSIKGEIQKPGTWTWADVFNDWRKEWKARKT